MSVVSFCITPSASIFISNSLALESQPLHNKVLLEMQSAISSHDSGRQLDSRRGGEEEVMSVGQPHAITTLYSQRPRSWPAAEVSSGRPDDVESWRIG